MAIDFSKISVLLVEDSLPMQQLISSMLEEFGVKQTHIADNGEQGYAKFCLERPDIVIADWMMQPEDGIDLVKKIRTDDKSPNFVCPVIMLTGYNSMKRVMMARDAGVTEYLVKPFTATDIANRLAYVINEPRDFIDCKDFFGPDRRRRIDLGFKGPFRRNTDTDVEVR